MKLCNCIPFPETSVSDHGVVKPPADIPRMFDTYTILNEAKGAKHIIKEGYLYKTSKFLNQSRKRWMVLHGIKLYSFKDREYYYPTETLDLTEYDLISITHPDDSITNDSKKACFELKSSLSLKSRAFIAQDLSEMYAWVQFIAAIQAQHIQIDISIKHADSLFADTLQFYISYHDSLSLSNIIQYAIKQYEMRHSYTQTLWMTHITCDSFTDAMDGNKDTGFINPNARVLKQSITEWNYRDIHKKGLYLYVNNIYIHRISDHHIDCGHMLDKHSSDPMQCPIYCAMIRSKSKQYSDEDYNHLNEFTHFEDSYAEKPHCIFYRNCASYKRMRHGPCSISDLCHMQLYKHPPRSQRAVDNQKNINKLFLNTNIIRNIFVHPLKECKASNFNVLTDEIIHNGFESDLHSIWDVIYDKYDTHRHLVMGKPLQLVHILALFMYTNGKCGYDLSRCQRKGNYKKWTVFDYFLFEAIYKLSTKEIGCCGLYLGVNYHTLCTRKIRNCHFVTYASASCMKQVSMQFVCEQGMCIRIPQETRNNLLCCDVSWISNFPDEHQVLIARSTNVFPQCLDGVVVNQANEMQNIQHIELKNRFRNTQEIWQYFMNKQLEFLTCGREEDSVCELELKEAEPYGDLKMMHKKLTTQKRTHHVPQIVAINDID